MQAILAKNVAYGTDILNPKKWKRTNSKKYCEQVKKVLQEYKDVRQQANINDEGLSATVERKAKPFVEGHFTLAIVGKMSAGKSTFINAFLGQTYYLQDIFKPQLSWQK